ncbi:unnamed protein product [Trifolium pratense]|uniref:Uncharacterized protein n=1 Tax=Trifolium pratense TaxID=57577 RepID=A0ACB0KXK4_TRIPR|nr:unnamed protein product [Trifolium pratense]
MKLEGKLQNIGVMVLVDSGASHNFISSKLATALELPITQMAARKRKIKLGDGHKVLSQGVCEGVKVNLGSIEVSVDALVLDLGGLDVILGVSWLCTLGQVMMDWKTLTMQFWSDGKSITLQGQRKNMAQNCYLNSFLEGRQEGLGGDWWIPQIEKANSGMSMKHELNGVLHQFATVFQDNIRLPPERPQVHYIKLFPDHGPVSVRPYRYPHHQKEEIERQVHELLQAGVIRPSMSAFSSPVILVKKKDNSWRICHGELNVIVSSPQWLEGQKLLMEVSQDANIQRMMTDIKEKPESKPGFYVKKGILFYKGRLVISPDSPSIPLLLKEFHSTPMGGHSSFLRTYRRIADNIYWIGMQKTVRNFVQSCDVCQRQKHSATSPGGLLQPLPIPNAIWEDLSIDFITGLPKSKGYEAILVVVDRLSKYSHFILLKHPYNAKTIAELFVKEVVRLHGIPCSIISDRDPIFMSHFWMELFKLQGTNLKMSSAYHPETDGQTEVVEKVEIEYLPKKVDLYEGMDEEFRKIFEKFSFTDVAASEETDKKPRWQKMQLLKRRLVLILTLTMKKTSKKKKLQRRMKIAELKQVWDATAADPKLLVFFKPKHWCQKRNFLQVSQHPDWIIIAAVAITNPGLGKHGIEKQPFQLPDFIASTGIEKIRQSIIVWGNIGGA